jgi:hypothetical protein
MSFFIMMNSQDGKRIMPVVDEEEEVCLFDTYDEAKKLGDGHHAASHFGFEIFQRGNGE